MAAFRLQSAMEYLMTYGWAILIIAVVLGALFGLGFFNSANLAPKVAAGACQVYRPQGPGTTSFINLEGTCNNELPQYVAKFNGGNNGNIHTNLITINGTPMMPSGASARTVTVWVLPSAGNYDKQRIIVEGNPVSKGTFGVTLYAANNPYMWGYGNDYSSTMTITNNTWSFMAFVYSGGTSVTIYANGASSTGSLPAALATAPSTNLTIGGGLGYVFSGEIADVQLYNTSLSSNEVTAIYQEGIGGVPILPQHLVGWWPLNGNANDYSGNMNNGAPTGVVYTSSWTAGYSAP